ncbi:MAG: SAP domain-containing protein [Actinomycetes bacterium]
MSIQTPNIPQFAQESFSRLAEIWAEGFARGLGRFQVPEPPTAILNPNTFVSEYFDAAQQVLEANRAYVKSLANVATNFQHALREQAASSVDAVRGQVGSVVENVVHQVEEQSVVLHEVQEEARQEAEAAADAAEKEARAAARAAEKEARDEVRSQYEDLRKQDLVDELGRRNLPKTGNVDELVARLVEDDLK